jgi:endonuclease YncB( thermonuclease family)
MRTSQSRAWQQDARQPRPSLFPAGARPAGAPIMVLAVVLAVALAIHGFQRAKNRFPAQIHWDVHGEIAGKVRVIDGDTIDIRGTHIRLLGIDAPEADQTCTDAGNRAWRCGQAATRVLIERIAGRSLKCETSGFDGCAIRKVAANAFVA